MRSAAALREQIESSLAARIPGALSNRVLHSQELVSTGIAEVDALLQGGLPLGSLAEITGPACSGRTTLVSYILTGATQQGASCAYVDAADAFDPLSASAMGLNLRHLLWVRVGRTQGRAIPENAAALPEIPCKVNPNSSIQEVYCGSSGRHPRMESRGMDRAVEKLFRTEGGLLRDKNIGNPGTTNRKLAEPIDYTPRCSESVRGRRVEQVSIDRQPAMRGQSVLHRESSVAVLSASSYLHSTPGNRSAKEIWTSLDRALRATDLLLNAGGFRVIVLDMGDVCPEQVRRVPLATWHRYRLQAEKSQTLFLLLTQTASAQSCASVVLYCKEAQERWQCSTEKHDGWSLLTGFQYSLGAVRKRAAIREVECSLGKKPTAATEISWKRTTLWAT
jgi:recombination protein RecA